MKNKRFFIGWLAVVGCTSWLAGCIAADVDEESDSQEQLGPDIAGPQLGLGPSPSKPKGYPNCGIIACPAGTTCAFDQSGEAVCMAPPKATCSTVDCGAYFHCTMTATGAVCAPGGSDG